MIFCWEYFFMFRNYQFISKFFINILFGQFFDDGRFSHHNWIQSKKNDLMCIHLLSVFHGPRILGSIFLVNPTIQDWGPISNPRAILEGSQLLIISLHSLCLKEENCLVLLLTRISGCYMLPSLQLLWMAWAWGALSHQ